VNEQELAAWRALLSVHAQITARIESALAEAGLPPLTWYDVLWPLHRALGRRLRVGALAEQVTLSRTGLTRLLDRIERDGLIRRVSVPEDRRGSYVVVTSAGSAMLRKMWPVYERVLDEQFAARIGNARTLRRELESLLGS
jgi:DNA-binding MarR family transcriptional regulator